MNNIRKTVILCLIVLLPGCSQQEPPQKPSSQEKANSPALIKDQKVVGMVRNANFDIEQAILENGTLTLRQGSEFFADVSVAIITFDHENLEEKTFSSSGNPGHFQPHIRLGLMKEGENLPDETTLVNGYDLLLKFGKEEKLGIPFSIRLVAPENGTSIEGKSFATYNNIRVVNEAVDTQLDSFDTLEYLANKTINLEGEGLVLKAKFGVSYTGYGNDYPKAGFVGYELTTGDGTELVVKIQLAKDENGWKVLNQLDPREIHQAHPVVTNIEGNLRTVEGAKARHVAAQQLERYLNEEELIENVRATSMGCYLAKKADKASCRGVYGLKNGEETKCQNINYLLVRDGENWQVDSEILDTQKVDYSSGELVSNKPFAMHCQ
jgi:hypothetical protein